MILKWKFFLSNFFTPGSETSSWKMLQPEHQFARVESAFHQEPLLDGRTCTKQVKNMIEIIIIITTIIIIVWYPKSCYLQSFQSLEAYIFCGQTVRACFCQVRHERAVHQDRPAPGIYSNFDSTLFCCFCCFFLGNVDNYLFLQGAKNLAGDTFDVLFVGTNRGKVFSHNLIEFLVCFLSLFFSKIYSH